MDKNSIKNNIKIKLKIFIIFITSLSYKNFFSMLNKNKVYSAKNINYIIKEFNLKKKYKSISNLINNNFYNSDASNSDASNSNASNSDLEKLFIYNFKKYYIKILLKILKNINTSNNNASKHLYALIFYIFNSNLDKKILKENHDSKNLKLFINYIYSKNLEIELNAILENELIENYNFSLFIKYNKHSNFNLQPIDISKTKTILSDINLQNITFYELEKFKITNKKNCCNIF